MRFISILFLSVAISYANAQSFTVTGTVGDLFTENGIDSAHVELLRADSSLLAVTLAEIPFTEEQVTSNVLMSRKAAPRPLPTPFPATSSSASRGSSIRRGRENRRARCWLVHPALTEISPN